MTENNEEKNNYIKPIEYIYDVVEQKLVINEDIIKKNNIDSYYISDKGNLIGLIPKTSNVIIIEDEFIKFDKNTRLLYGKNNIIYLDPKKIESTNNPPLYNRTNKFLNNLSK